MGFDTYVSDIILETKECKNLESAQDDPQDLPQKYLTH